MKLLNMLPVEVRMIGLDMEKYLTGCFSIYVKTDKSSASMNDSSSEKMESYFVFNNFQLVEKVDVRHYESESWSSQPAYEIKGGHKVIHQEEVDDYEQISEQLKMDADIVCYFSSANSNWYEEIEVKGVGEYRDSWSMEDWEKEQLPKLVAPYLHALVDAAVWAGVPLCVGLLKHLDKPTFDSLFKEAVGYEPCEFNIHEIAHVDWHAWEPIALSHFFTNCTVNGAVQI